MARRGRQPSSSAGPPAPFQPTSAGLGGIKAVFTGEAFDSSSTQRPPSTSSLWPPSVVRSPGAPRVTALRRCGGSYESKARPSTRKRIATHFILRDSLYRAVWSPPRGTSGVGLESECWGRW